MQRIVRYLSIAILMLGLAWPVPGIALAAEPNDEIHSDFGNDAGTSVWLHWRGPDTQVAYGTTIDYGQTATAQPSAIKPVDIAGPFMEVQLSGLTPGTEYHYRIGPSGTDHQFKTAPAGDFLWDDVGDTGSTLNTYNPGPPAYGCNKPWMADTWNQLSADNPDFVTHGGDISYANECGVGSIHQLYQDIAPIATRRVLQFAWGNHEYGAPPTTGVLAPPGTPRDQLANYKGRSYIANPQTLSFDTATRTSPPGCPYSGTVNTCQGEDWGWFKVGHVLYISYPEPFSTAYAEWQTKADALMAGAQADPNITFVITYGHRPAYTSLFDSSTGTYAVAAALQTAINALGDKYSPAARTDGKYVLNVAHHIHGGEVFAPQHGVVHVTNGGGGTEETNYGKSTAPGSLWKTTHPEHLRATMSGSQMKLEIVCGPVFTPNPSKDACNPGDTIYTQTLGSAGTPSPTPTPSPSASPTPSPTPSPSATPSLTDYFGSCDKSVESSLSCYSGLLNSNSKVEWYSGSGSDGTHSVRVTNTGTATAYTGLKAKPAPISSTVAGRTYTASVCVRAPVTGVTLQMMLKEVRPDGSSPTPGKAIGSWTATDTNWHCGLTISYAAAENGNTLTYTVQATNLAPAAQFFADQFALTSPN